MADDFEKLLELADGQIRQQGMAAVRLKDGTAFILTAETLEKLLLRARDSEEQRVMIFIPTNPN